MLSSIAEWNPAGEIATAHATLNRRLDQIMILPFGSKRWIAAKDLLLETNPYAGEDDAGRPLSFRRVNDACVKANRVFREGLINKWGGSETKTKGLTSGNTMRATLSMPRLLYTTIELVDPNAFKTAKNRQKMFKIFPEYVRAEVYSGVKD